MREFLAKGRVMTSPLKNLFFMLLLSLSSYSFGSCCGLENMDYEIEMEEEPRFLAFVSLSIPETSFYEMSKHLERIGGQFVFRGMPNNSFHEFIAMIMDFRQKGILAPITIDPDSFEEYEVVEVPTFVLLPPSREILSAKKLSRAFEDTSLNSYKKIVGNVSIPYALQEMGEEL